MAGDAAGAAHGPADAARWRGCCGSSSRRCPAAGSSRTFYREQEPDVVLITPLVDLGSPQLDHYLSARALGLRTVLCVGSWDHLSSKSLLRAIPDLVTVWNDTQKQEAIELHQVPPDRIVVTGAQCYDQWFGRTAVAPARGVLRADRARRIAAVHPLRLLVAVQEHGERGAVRRTVDPARARQRGSRCCGRRACSSGRIPRRLDEWQQVDLTEFKNVTLFGSHPVDPATKDDYFDSLYYASAVVGLNTSAFLEAGVVGKPVLSVLLPEISTDNQEGTIHFHYLLNVGGGLLEVARSLEEHVAQLAATLADPAPGRRSGRAGLPRGSSGRRGWPSRQRRGLPPRSKRRRSGRRRAPVGAPPAAWVARVLLLPWLAFAQLRDRHAAVPQGDALQVPPFPPPREEAGVPEDPALRRQRG